MSQINISDLTFYYDGSYNDVFNNVSFTLDSNWRLGFIGRNGRGKTTFLNILMGKYEYKGAVQTNLAFEYFPFQINPVSFEKNTIDIIEEIEPDYELWMIIRELTLLNVDADILYRSYSTLSNGEQTKVMLALLFSKENHFLLIDEPTNHLDESTRLLVKSYLSKKKGFILVSHDRDLLDGCVDHILVINRTNIEVFQGNFTTWWNNKQLQDEHELSVNDQLKKDIGRLNEAFKRTEGWSNQIEASKIGNHVGDRGFIGHKSAKMMKRAKSVEQRVEKAIDEKSLLLKNIESNDELKLFFLNHHKDILISAKDFSISYNGNTIFSDLSFEVKRGECVALKGKNGCGKSSILKKILGYPIESFGSLEVASGLKISYVSQDTSFLNGHLNDFINHNQLDQALFKSLLFKLGFERYEFGKNIEEYSSGQKKKILIAKSLLEQAHLYLWDEPLNFIDIFSRMQIENLIKEYRPTMVLVEHDSSFVRALDSKVILIQD